MHPDHSRLVSGEGVHAVGLLAHKLGILFRSTGEHDKGIDGELELTQSISVRSPFIKIQIKARSEFRLTKKKEISITVTEQNLRYWKQAGHPVLLMAYSKDIVYWTRVDNASSRTIKINPNQIFDETSVSMFVRIISQYYTNLAENTPIEDLSVILTDIGPTVGTILKANTEKISRANNLMVQRNYQEATRIYEALAIIYENSSSIYYNWGVSLLGLHKLDEALEIAMRVLKDTPNKWQVHNLVGVCLVGLNKYDEAEPFFVTSLQLAPACSITWETLGMMHYWQNRNEEALEELRIAISYSPDNGGYYFNLALCLTVLEMYKEALDAYDMCIKLNPRDYDTFNNKGSLLKHLWRLWEAMEHFDEAIKIEPSNPIALRNSASLLKDLGYNERAIQRYHLALASQPDNSSSIHTDLGALYCRTGEWSTAAYHFRLAYSYLGLQIEHEKYEDAAIIDGGFDVVYFIKMQVSKSSVRIVSVDDGSEIAMLKQPFFQWYLKYAHVFNQPLKKGLPPSFPADVSEGMVFNAELFIKEEISDMES